MNDIIRYIKDQIEQVTKSALLAMDISGKDTEEFKLASEGEIEIEIPKEKAHGDFSINTAMKLTKILRTSPQNIAKALTEAMNFEGTYIEKCEIAGPGFINFYLNKSWLWDGLKLIDEKGASFGRIDIGNGKKVMVEFVSANPTGPMHMGNARGGALGDGIASILETAGYDVTREFYINDAGAQIEKFGKSLEAKVTLNCGRDWYEFAKSAENDLVSAFIVSAVEIGTSEFDGVDVKVEVAPGEKCERCWTHSHTVGQNAEHPTLCTRCAEIVG